MGTLFVSAFVMGLIFVATPGIIAVEAVRRGLAQGHTAALKLQFGSLIGDATWALIALLGVSVLFQNRLTAIGLSLFGCFLIFRFAWEAYHASRKELALDGQHSTRQGHFVAGAALSLSNPQNLTFWLGMSGTIIGMGFLNPQPAHIAVFMSGYMLAAFLWCFVFAALVGVGRRLVNQRLFYWLNLICAAALAYFGFALLIGTVQLIFSAP
ncbi:MAG: LysE family transporter [Anaerolineae bacterium]|nr:LysE family transporter [Anaerolineae bacterium]